MQVAIFVDIFNGTTPPEEMDVECMYWVGDLDEPPIHAAGKARRMFDDHFKYSPCVPFLLGKLRKSAALL